MNNHNYPMYRYIWIILNAIYVRRYFLFYLMNANRYELNSVRRTRNNSNYSKRYLLTWYWQYLYPVCHKSFEHKAKSIKKSRKIQRDQKDFISHLPTCKLLFSFDKFYYEIWKFEFVLSLSLPPTPSTSELLFLFSSIRKQFLHTK